MLPKRLRSRWNSVSRLPVGCESDEPLRQRRFSVRRLSQSCPYRKILSRSLSSISGPVPFPNLWRAACFSSAGTLCPIAGMGVPIRAGCANLSTRVLRRDERRRETIQRNNAKRERARLRGAIGSLLSASQSRSSPGADHRTAGGERSIAGSNRGGVWGDGTCDLPLQFASRIRRPCTD